MKQKQYISVKEFAERAGVTTQAVYQRLDKDLKKYCKIEGKYRKLDIEGLNLYQKEESEQENLQNIDKDLLKTLQDTLQVLTTQLEAKDKQIAELNKRLEEAFNTTSQSHYIAVQAQQQIVSRQEKPKKGFFSRLFKKD